MAENGKFYAVCRLGFYKTTKNLALKVPSACIMNEYNYLINPAHPSITEIKLLRSEPFEFDERLFNTKIPTKRETLNPPAKEEDL